MAEYEVKWQTQEMWENDEWGTHYHDSWKEAITEAWEMRYDPDYVTVQVYEIHCVTFKDDNREKEKPIADCKNDNVQFIEDIYKRIPENWVNIIEKHIDDVNDEWFSEGYRQGCAEAERENKE